MPHAALTTKLRTRRSYGCTQAYLNWFPRWSPCRFDGPIYVLTWCESEHREKLVKKYKCRCDCGKEKLFIAERLNGPRPSLSCRCLANELTSIRSRTHGECAGDERSHEYGIWHAMKRRCHEPSFKSYDHYGGRGIKVCDEWMNDFPAFLAHIGRAPPDTMLDRIDGTKGYEPGNVRWADRQTQMQNRCNTIWVMYQGERMCLAEAARRACVTRSVFKGLVKKGRVQMVS